LKQTYVRVRLDRLQFTCEKKRSFGLPDIPGFKVVSDRLVRQRTRVKTYERVRRYRNHKSGTQVFVAYKPVPKWLPPVKVTMVANDETGLQWDEVALVDKTFEGGFAVIVELALDFDESAGVDLRFIRRHALFGGSRPKTGPRYPGVRYWGSPASAKLVRCYRKASIRAFRVELQLRRACLQRYGMLGAWTLCYGIPDLVKDHARFLRPDWAALEAHVVRRGLRAKKVLRQARLQAKSLHRLLDCLRHNLQVRNPQRFLRPMKLNREIDQAVEAWADSFDPSRQRKED